MERSEWVECVVLMTRLWPHDEIPEGAIAAQYELFAAGVPYQEALAAIKSMAGRREHAPNAARIAVAAAALEDVWAPDFDQVIDVHRAMVDEMDRRRAAPWQCPSGHCDGSGLIVEEDPDGGLVPMSRDCDCRLEMRRQRTGVPAELDWRRIGAHPRVAAYFTPERWRLWRDSAQMGAEPSFYAQQREEWRWAQERYTKRRELRVLGVEEPRPAQRVRVGELRRLPSPE